MVAQQDNAMMTLQDRCLGLPYLERLNLCSALQESILQERMERRHPRPSRCGVLTALMEETIGETIPSKSRETRFVWARAMVVYQLRQEGFTLMEIGRMMGMHHSSVFHLEGKMKDALMYSFAYRDVIDIWKQFQNRIQDDIQRGTTQDLICV
jgi:hypothetical protein